jgi:hypothetical protein
MRWRPLFQFWKRKIECGPVFTSFDGLDHHQPSNLSYPLLDIRTLYLSQIKLDPALLRNLGNKDRHTAFRTVIDEQYRYHQFWGGLNPDSNKLIRKLVFTQNR